MRSISTFNAIPVMTSTTTPSGITSASSELNSNSASWKAFGVDGGYWYSTNNPTAWLEYQFPKGKMIGKYSISSSSADYPKSWTFEGSNDGISWIVLDTRINIIDWSTGIKKDFLCSSNIGLYTRYRMNMSSSQSGTYYKIVNLSMYEIITQNKILLPSGEGKIFSVDPESYIDAIPAMTSDTSTTGVSSCSSVYSTNNAWKAFDKADDSAWYNSATGMTGWLQYKFVEPVNIRRYSLHTYAFNNTQCPKNFTFEASNDGSSWIVLDTKVDYDVTHIPQRNLPVYIDINNKEKYLYYRLNVTRTVGGNTGIVIIELGMYTYKEVVLMKLDSVSEQNFLSYGFNSSSSINLSSSLTKIQQNISKPNILGSGKTFEHTIDMSKSRIDKIALS